MLGVRHRERQVGPSHFPTQVVDYDASLGEVPRRVLLFAEIQRVMEHLTNPRDEALFCLMVFMGLPPRVLAPTVPNAPFLRRADLDLATHVLHVLGRPVPLGDGITYRKLRNHVLAFDGRRHIGRPPKTPEPAHAGALFPLTRYGLEDIVQRWATNAGITAVWPRLRPRDLVWTYRRHANDPHGAMPWPTVRDAEAIVLTRAGFKSNALLFPM